jgi:hypothetical protein
VAAAERHEQEQWNELDRWLADDEKEAPGASESGAGWHPHAGNNKCESKLAECQQRTDGTVTRPADSVQNCGLLEGRWQRLALERTGGRLAQPR